MIYYLRAILMLTAVYLALTSNLAWNNILVGLLLSVGVIYLVRPQLQSTSIRGIIPATINLIRYIVILVIDMVLSGIQVAIIVLSPTMPIRQGIIAIHSNCTSEVGTALSAHAITLTPGELVVEIDDDGVCIPTAWTSTNQKTAWPRNSKNGWRCSTKSSPEG
jgi:multicomponent Na+:H+ antiporter subunit E